MARIHGNHFDLSKIGLRENYKLNILGRFGGKTRYYLKVKNLCFKVQHHFQLAPFFLDYDAKELHRCLLDILNSAFQKLPESFDMHAHFQEEHQKILNAGMKATDFDTFALIFEELMWDTAVDESLVRDSVQMLRGLRRVFVAIERETNGQFVRETKLERAASKKLQKTWEHSSTSNAKSGTKKSAGAVGDSQRSVCTADMTVFSADELEDMNNSDYWGYQSWNSVTCTIGRDWGNY